ncbi:uncharacterized protein LOC124194600 [Daphnia pulex]|uniref:uncharacterized protein LOC124194600 n=1 Tax=Daphnia pulex TaxID=6669 RepID=UPI001EDE2731|nr:uncharacterized protein LOC124194600 [Daphnia pulex]XP_046444816.1 uncharacterized protein LOC124194600 [Daphnia pulex]XP_046444817.1 uncharacterized protein LOC124194600 [Daphnia pulex]
MSRRSLLVTLICTLALACVTAKPVQLGTGSGSGAGTGNAGPGGVSLLRAAGLAEMNNAVPVIAEIRFPDLRGGYGEGEEAARVSGLSVGKVAPKGGVGSGGTGNKAQ